MRKCLLIKVFNNNSKNPKTQQTNLNNTGHVGDIVCPCRDV